MSRSLANLSPRRWPVAVVAACVLALPAACSGDDDSLTPTPAATATDDSAVADETTADPVASNGERSDETPTTGTTATSGTAGAASSGSDATGDADASDLGAVGGVLDSAIVHEITVEFDQADYDDMIETYTSTGEKDTIPATVTINGQTFQEVGIRLKGNSSLRGLLGGGRAGATASASAASPETLPWLIDLDEYVDGQSYDGLTEIVVRSSNSETALNEAVALELLERAGLASQDAVAVGFSVNGSDRELRLAIEHPDDTWMADVLSADGALYKAESSGDYSYRGDDPDAYDEVFDQEAGKDVTDLTPLIEFLEFVNESDDATFAAELSDRLDVDAFATYLAMQELLNNFDDIDGPGNNSYLFWDAETGVFTVVPWDYNLAFGGLGGTGGGGAGGAPVPGGGGFGDGGGRGDTATDGALPGGGGFGGRGGTNVLVERFLANPDWQALYEERLAELTASLYESGVAADLLEEWTAVVAASGLVDEATITSEAARIAAQF